MYKTILFMGAVLLLGSQISAGEKAETKENARVSNRDHQASKVNVYWRGPYRHGYGYGHGGWGHGYGNGYGWGGHSSTAAEGYMRGQGARAAGYGQYLRAVGQYENMHQEALTKHYENEETRIKKYWEIKRFWEDEQQARKEDKASRNERARNLRLKDENSKLDYLEARNALEKRKDALRKKGLLPAKVGRTFIYKGKDYGTYANFMKTEEYILLKAAAAWKRHMDNAKARMEEQKEEEALEFLAHRSQLTPYGRMKADKEARAIRTLEKHMGKSWVMMFVTAPEKYNPEFIKALQAPLPEPFKRYEVITNKK